jgi:hypothetical protein
MDKVERRNTMADRAVLFGINHYKSISALNGCANDVNNIYRLLTETYGFSPHNIRHYTNADVTRQQVIDGFDWLIDTANNGDRLVFHFSGHGSYINRDDGDEDIDELICLYDMDWENPDSYLLDDDLGQLTRKVAQGVRLTIILDCCHSGSGTRALTTNLHQVPSPSPTTCLMIVEDTKQQLTHLRDSGTERYRDIEDEAIMRSLQQGAVRPVLARFVEPPPRFRLKSSAFRIRRLGRQSRATLNHQLLAGAADYQTAADAFIDGDYHGAFSYYLCETSRHLGARATVQQIMDRAITQLSTQGYSQKPQNEGAYSNDVLFGALASPFNGLPTGGSTSEEKTLTDVEPSLTELSATGRDGVQPLELLAQLLHVSERLIHLADRQIGATPPIAKDTRTTGNEYVVYVHGISQHRAGYSRPWWAAMEPHLTRPMEHQEVLWSHHVNPRALSRIVRVAEADELARAIERELEARMAQLEQQAQLSGARASESHLERPRGDGFAIDDFTFYMLNPDIRNAILNEFDAIVRPLLQSGKTVHIISHSWGTVVSYEGLRNMSGEIFNGRVANLFVVGSALSINVVQANLFRRVADGRRPSMVDRIINLDAGGDIIGGPIGENFSVHREFLRLDPVGCNTIPFTDIAWNPTCAHGSYFNAENEEVNNHIFTHFILPATGAVRSNRNGQRNMVDVSVLSGVSS